MIRGRSEDRDVTVLGQADVVRNGHLAEQGNAALSLRLLGARPTLVWYLPDPLELSDGASAPSLRSLLPDWVGWVTAQVLIALLLAVFWRARRLGPLVTEPLPVVVRAAETQEGRARLYRQAGARGRAAATLRTATARRLAARLDVPPDADPSTVAVLAAQVVGQPPDQVAETLLGHAPHDDAALVALADRLDALERAVAGTRVATGRRTGGPVGSAPAAGPAAGSPAASAPAAGPAAGSPAASAPAAGPAAGSPAAGTHPSTNGRSGSGRPDREAPPR